MKNILLSIVIAATMAVVCPNNVSASNEFFVGVSLNLSTNGAPDFGSLRPWFKIQIDRSTPTETNRFRAGEMHHLYVGSVLYGLGRLTNKKILRVAGIVLVVDDVVQHTMRVTSPVHMMSDWLYRYEWYRAMSQAGDKVVGHD